MRTWMYAALAGALMVNDAIGSINNCFDDHEAGLPVSSAQGATFAEATAAQKNGDTAKAERLLRALVSDLELSPPVAQNPLGLVVGRLAGVLLDQGSYVEAESSARRALQLLAPALENLTVSMAPHSACSAQYSALEASAWKPSRSHAAVSRL